MLIMSFPLKASSHKNQVMVALRNCSVSPNTIIQEIHRIVQNISTIVQEMSRIVQEMSRII